MTRIGHDIVMKSAKVSELKAHLSAYLAEVRHGETVIVCDRNTPVARLVPYEDDRDGFRIEKPSRPPGELRKVRGVELTRPTDVLGLLRESRDQR
jgi:prevent-host-death family protein